MIYKLSNNPEQIIRIDEVGVVAFVPSDPANSDWQAYQVWLAADPENNIPLPAGE